MLATILSGAVYGVDAFLVRVEVDLGPGLPAMTVVGLPESAVREGRERVVSALQNTGYPVPPGRITVNLAPADMRKEGSAFDLPIALGLLGASADLPPDALAGVCCVGELGLDGELRPVRGAIAIALSAARSGARALLVPLANAREAAVVDGVEVHAAGSLGDVVRHLRGQGRLPVVRLERDRLLEPDGAAPPADLADVLGQEHAKRALEVAAAGGHNLLLMGPPGSGKSMLARRIPGILPRLTLPEALEVTRVHSVAGRLRGGEALVTTRPFRAPHHSTSDAGLIGGGGYPRPGEASLAHHGVLFLDELPEFRRSALEALRQPLEDGTVHLGRARAAVSLPARFMLIAAMNPCPCGYYGDGEARCTCHTGQVQRYRARISGPLMDRIDLHVEVPSARPAQLLGRGTGEASEAVRRRVERCREVQLVRFRARPGIYANGQMEARDVRSHCRLDEAGEALIRGAVGRLGLSARACHRVLKVARTIADMEGAERIRPTHVAEAVQYRSLDRRTGAASGATSR